MCNDIDFRYKKLKKGERVRVSAFHIPFYNCFCDSCNYKWHEELKTKLFTKSEWDARFSEKEVQKVVQRFEISYAKQIPSIRRKAKKKRFLQGGAGVLLFLLGTSSRKAQSNLWYINQKVLLLKQYKQNKKDEEGDI